MRRAFLIPSLALALIGGATFLYAPAAHAASSNPLAPSAPIDAATLTAVKNSTFSTSPAGIAAGKTSTQLPPETDIAKTGVFSQVMIFIMGLFAWLVGVAAMALDYSVYYTVVNMGSYVHNLTAIGTTWRILRDVGNILLIFGFLASGIAVILDTDVYGWGQKALPMLLVAAVFINFSLFFTEAVIDVGNLFAVQFYTQINGGQPAQAYAGITGTASNISSNNISNILMGQLGLQTIYNVNDGQVGNKVFFDNNPALVGFLGIILFAITAFVLFSLTFILVTRFIYLIFVIILSPVAIAGWAAPRLSKVSDWWLGTLIDNTITAPVLLLLLYVALAVITDANFFMGTSKDYLGFVANSNLPGFISVLLSFVIAMGLLLAVVFVAKKLSVAGANWSTKAAGTVVGGAIGYVGAGSISLAGRTVFGGTGRVLNNQWMQARASKRGVGGVLARAGAFTGRNLENRTFDLRNVKTLKKVAGAAVGAAGGFGAVDKISLGKGATVTAKQAVDKTQETWKKVKPFQGSWWRDQQKEYEKAAKEREKEKDLIPPSERKFKDDDERKKATEDWSKNLNKMSAEELAELRGIRKGMPEWISALSPKKYAELQKLEGAKAPLKAEKEKIEGAWKKMFDDDNIKETMDRIKKKSENVAALDAEFLMKAAGAGELDMRELDAIRQKNELDIDKRRELYEAVQKHAKDDEQYKQKLKEYFDEAKNKLGEKREDWWGILSDRKSGGTSSNQKDKTQSFGESDWTI